MEKGREKERVGEKRNVKKYGRLEGRRKSSKRLRIAESEKIK